MGCIMVVTLKWIIQYQNKYNAQYFIQDNNYYSLKFNELSNYNYIQYTNTSLTSSIKLKLTNKYIIIILVLAFERLK